MNKSQIILAAIGGVVAVGALALGYFIWDASGVKAENAEALADNFAAASGVVQKLPVRPEASALKVYKDGCAAYDDWRAEAGKIVSRGDLVFEKTTPAVFKTAIVDEARKFAERPGCFGGKIVKPDFHFGFKDYITGGALPPDNEAELGRLQREWNDVYAVLKTIAECGGGDVGISDVKMGKAKAAVAEAEEQPQPAAKKRKAKKARKAKAKAEPEGEGEAAEPSGPAVTSFTVDFQMRPSALVKALNAFATGQRFVVVDSCTFARERDELAENLGGDAKKTAEQSARTGSRRRRGQQQAQPEKQAEAKKGVVTDPAHAPLLKVSMALSVHDFGTLEKAKEEVEAEAKTKEEGDGEEESK